jgi:hypothetical protein
LGLALARAVVELHGGRIWVEDIPGGGIAFAFVLSAPWAPGGANGGSPVERNGNSGGPVNGPGTSKRRAG